MSFRSKISSADIKTGNEPSEYTIIRPLGQKGVNSIAKTLKENVCRFCGSSIANYTCPKCRNLYCSLSCYKSLAHKTCRRSFLESQQEAETPAAAVCEPIPEETRRMLEIVDKYGVPSGNGRQKIIEADKSSDQANEWHYVVPPVVAEKKAELSRLYRRPDVSLLPDSDEEEISPEEMKELENIVNNATKQELFDMLTPEEKAEFQRMLESGKYDVYDSEEEEEGEGEREEEGNR